MSENPHGAGFPPVRFGEPVNLPPTPEKETKMTEQPPAYPVPTMGWQKIWYQMRQAQAGPGAKPPRLSKKEQLIVAEQQRAATERASVLRLCQLTDDTRHGVVSFVNAKGGAGVTPTLVNTACMLASRTHVTTLVFDGNPAEGTAARRLGKEHDETITVDRLFRDRAELSKSFQRFIGQARPNHYSVRSISANSTTDDSDNPSLDPDLLTEVLDVTAENIEYLFLDTPNVVFDKVGLALMGKADVLVFTAFVDNPDSLRQLGTSMQALRKKGLAKMVDRSVVVITGLAPNMQLSDYQKFLHRVNMQNEVIQNYPKFDGPFIGIPFDPEVRRDDVVNIEAWQPATRQAYLELGIAILEQLQLIQADTQESTPLASPAQAAPIAPTPSSNGHVPEHIAREEITS